MTKILGVKKTQERVHVNGNPAGASALSFQSIFHAHVFSTTIFR